MIKSLSYVGFSSPAILGRYQFATQMLGLQDVSDTAEDTVRLRMDEAVWRIAVHAGEANALEYIGWDVGDQRGFDAVGLPLGDNRVDLHLAPASLAQERGVSALGWFYDPAGFRPRFPLTDVRCRYTIRVSSRGLILSPATVWAIWC